MIYIYWIAAIWTLLSVPALYCTGYVYTKGEDNVGNALWSLKSIYHVLWIIGIPYLLGLLIWNAITGILTKKN